MPVFPYSCRICNTFSLITEFPNFHEINNQYNNFSLSGRIIKGISYNKIYSAEFSDSEITNIQVAELENLAIHVAGSYILDCEGIVWKWNKENYENPIKFHDDILPKIRTVKKNSCSTFFVGIDGSVWVKISKKSEISLLSNSHDVIDVFVHDNIRKHFTYLLCTNGRIVRASYFPKDINQISFHEICPFSNVQSIMFCFEDDYEVKRGEDGMLSVFYLLSDNSIIISTGISTGWDISIKNVKKMENGWILTLDGKLLSLDINRNWKPVGKQKNIDIIDFVAFSHENVIFTDYSTLYYSNKEKTIALSGSERIFNQGKKSAYK